MRMLLIVLMMALAPLRAWAGDVMAIGMASEQALGSSHVGSSLAPVVVKGSMHGDAQVVAHGDCTGHGASEVAAVQHPDASRDDVASVHCATCSFCQVCSSPGLAITVNHPAAVRFAHAVPLSRGTHFTSAEHAPGLKPPIS